MRRLRKGSIWYIEGDEYHMVCGGSFWEWPFWKRVLSTIARKPYVWYAAERARFQWRLTDKDAPLRKMGRNFYIETSLAIADDHIRPIHYLMVKGKPDEMDD